jgi:galactokinase
LDRPAAFAEFERTFGSGGPIAIIRAPGRVNLIGEHTDYNDGFVLPIAIEPEVLIAFRPRTDSLIHMASAAFPDQRLKFSLQDALAPGPPSWSNYARGVTATFIAEGISLRGVDALISSTLLVGAGLSSSAALCVAIARALLRAAGRDIPPQQIARLCQHVEHEFAGVPCGIMDQMIVAAGIENHAMLLDCRTLEMQHVPLDPARVQILIANSMVSRELAGSAYADRRRECNEGLTFFQRRDPQIKALRDVTPAMLPPAQSDMPETIFRRCRHVVSENARTLEAVRLLEQNDYPRVGVLMCQSHASLRDDYEVSAPQLDFLVEESMQISGVHGARMTGGGFGGCIVALVHPDAVKNLSDHLTNEYAPHFGNPPQIIVTNATAGASVASP